MYTDVAPIFDIDSLLADISPDLPCGDDTREDASPHSPYFNLKDLRNQARALERQILAEDDLPQIQHWKQLAMDIPPVLAERSKDLEFVAWYIESLCREYGFSGLAQGFELARCIIENHWENLHPQPDEEGLSTRIAPLVGLNGVDGEGTLIQPILSIPLFSCPSLGSFATWHAEQVAEINRMGEDKAKQRIRAGAASPDDLVQAVRETPMESLLEIHRGITGAQASFVALSDAMDRVMGGEPQPTTNIRKALERCKSTLMHQAGEQIERALARKPIQASAGAAVPDGQESSASASVSVLDAVQVAIESRSQALDQLRQLSDFFRQTEPHSPVSYAISQAIRWSELSLPELMQELISDSGAREGFCRVTGVPAPEKG
ncbi:type VI secretion system protein TssA [Marinobacter sp.]|uniref:type VI secretion system protein TssA n=1 Tax=Marinobacter sp. TaxID=50741 RepID=UPI00384AAB12